jgi:hypothetical protein
MCRKSNLNILWGRRDGNSLICVSLLCCKYITGCGIICDDVQTAVLMDRVELGKIKITLVKSRSG